MNFHCFSLLPTELRLQIWKHAAHPRIVKVRREPYLAGNAPVIYYSSPQPVASLQHVCRESRYSGNYVKAFNKGSEPRYAWVNFTTDTISVAQFSLDDPEMEHSRIQNLRVFAEGAWLFEMEGIQFMDQFTALESLCIEVESEADDDFPAVWGELDKDRDVDWGCPRGNITILLLTTGVEMSLLNCIREYHDGMRRAVEELGMVYQHS